MLVLLFTLGDFVHCVGFFCLRGLQFYPLLPILKSKIFKGALCALCNVLSNAFFQAGVFESIYLLLGLLRKD